MRRIELLEPEEGSLTHPLQGHELDAGEDAARNRDPRTPFLPIDWEDLEIVCPDRSRPVPVRFAWAVNPPMRGLRYDLLIDTDPQFPRPRIVGNLRRPEAEVWNLQIGTSYCWKVVAQSSALGRRVSGVGRFRTHSRPPRQLRVDGMTNVRDVGGWPVGRKRITRQGMLYRGSEMNGHLQISPSGRRVLEDDLGIRTDLDLRGYTEDAHPVLDASRVQWVHLPIFPYESIVDAAFAANFLAIFELLSIPENYPVYMHCVGGADRAGTVAFLVNALLGVDPEDLMLDYEMTSLSIWGSRSRDSAQFQALLEALNGFGEPSLPVEQKVARYLESIGLEANAVQRIRRHFL